MTVANVSGLAVTPDAGTNSNIVAGSRTLTLSSASPTPQLCGSGAFLANGQSIRVVGAATIQSAIIVGPNTNIFTNTPSALGINRAERFHRRARAGQRDATRRLAALARFARRLFGGWTTFETRRRAAAFDKRTPHGLKLIVNGLREARGDISATVENDAQLQVTLTAPQARSRSAQTSLLDADLQHRNARSAMTLGSASGIYIIAPIPVGTALASGQTSRRTLYTLAFDDRPGCRHLDDDSARQPGERHSHGLRCRQLDGCWRMRRERLHAGDHHDD